MSDKLPELVVTRDGVPCPDQKAAVAEFWERHGREVMPDRIFAWKIPSMRIHVWGINGSVEGSTQYIKRDCFDEVMGALDMLRDGGPESGVSYEDWARSLCGVVLAKHATNTEEVKP